MKNPEKITTLCDGRTIYATVGPQKTTFFCEGSIEDVKRLLVHELLQELHRNLPELVTPEMRKSARIDFKQRAHDIIFGMYILIPTIEVELTYTDWGVGCVDNWCGMHYCKDKAALYEFLKHEAEKMKEYGEPLHYSIHVNGEFLMTIGDFYYYHVIKKENFNDVTLPW